MFDAKDIYVVKRRERKGSKREPWQIDKFRKAINWACQGTGVDSLLLEQSFNFIIVDGITTERIQSELVQSAIQLIDMNEWHNTLKWYLVAGRFLLQDLYKKTSITRKHNYLGYSPDFVNLYEKGIEYGIYDSVLNLRYTNEELKLAGQWIDSYKDMNYDYGTINKLINDGYLFTKEGAKYELPQERFMLMSLFYNMNESAENRMELVKQDYKDLSDRKLSPATPMYNALKPGASLSSCYTAKLDDSWASISHIIRDFGDITRSGGAEGIDGSRIRAGGSWIQKIKGAAKGMIPWAKIFNDVAIAVDQLGKRKGAMTIGLPIYHLDIMDFMDLQTISGEERRKAKDIFPQIIITDAFMHRLLCGKEWYTFDPYEIETKFNTRLDNLVGEEFTLAYDMLCEEADKGNIALFKKYPTNFVVKTIITRWFSKGLPYIFFKDTANKYNPNPHKGLIYVLNLCVESFGPTKESTNFKRFFDKEKGQAGIKFDPGWNHVCSLMSTNMANCKDEAEILRIYRTSIRLLDNSIDLTANPVIECALYNDMFRNIGAGSLGLHDFLAKNDKAYEESAEYIDKLFEKIAIASIETSINLAAKRGTYEAYKGSQWDKGIILGKDINQMLETSKFKHEWTRVYDLLNKHGIRNGQLNAIAPNTSTATIQGCTASVLPIYKPLFIEKDGENIIIKYAPFIDNKYRFYKSSDKISKSIIIDIIGRIQRWTDTGISTEYLFNLNDGVVAQDYYDMFVGAWKNGHKSIYYVRSIVPGAEDYEKTAEECVSCAG